MNSSPASFPRRALFIASSGLITARVMDAWLACGHGIAGLWIGPVDKRRYLGKNMEISLLRPRWSVAAHVRRHKIPVRAQTKLSRWPEARGEIERTGADVLITSATMQIVPEDILALFPGRAFNFHPAMLPHYRGPSPRQGMVLDRALQHGGLTCHLLTAGIDEGDVVGQRALAIDADAPYHDWDVAVAQAAYDLTRGEVQRFLHGNLKPMPQNLAAGNYRRVSQQELTIAPETSAEEARWLCRMLGDSGGILADAPGTRHGHYKVDRFVREDGPPTGAPVRAGLTTVSLDVADRRITLRRRTTLTRRLRRLALLRALYAHDRGRGQDDA